MQETKDTQVRSLGQEDPLQGGMATHSSILGWRIPWEEEHGGLQSMRSHRIGHLALTHPSRICAPDLEGGTRWRTDFCCWSILCFSGLQTRAGTLGIIWSTFTDKEYRSLALRWRPLLAVWLCLDISFNSIASAYLSSRFSHSLFTSK